MPRRRHSRGLHRARPRGGRVLPVLLAAVVLVGGANLAAYAANGEPLRLGRFNAESRKAVVQNNGAGPALELRSRANAPSLKVSSPRRVPRLNADRLDGRHAGALEARAWEIRLEPGELAEVWGADLDVPPGRYLASYQLWLQSTSENAANCRFRYPDGSGIGFSYPTSKSASFATVAGTAIIDTRGLDSPMRLQCSQLSTSRIYDGTSPSTVSLLALDRVTSRTVPTG